MTEKTEKNETKTAEWDVYSKLSKIDVSKYVKEKNGNKYLPWAACYSILLKYYPTAEWHIVEYDQYGMEIPYGTKAIINRTISSTGRSIAYAAIVHGKQYREECGSQVVTTEMTIEGVTRRMSLPVMKGFTNSPVADPDEMLMNKTKWRCLVKNAALFGLGINVYMGEDLPSDDENTAAKPASMTIKPVPAETAQQPAAKKSEKKPRQQTGRQADEPLDADAFLIETPYNGNTRAVSTKMVDLINKSTNQKASNNALKWYTENGNEKEKGVAKKLLEMLKSGEKKYPESSAA